MAIKSKANSPFNPAKSPFYYGWIILLLGTMGILMSIPGQTMGFSAFNSHFVDAFNLPMVYLTLAYLVGTGVSSTLMAYGGKLYDRFGVRKVAFVTVVVLGLVMVGFTYIDDISRSAPRIVTVMVITLGFFLMRFFGQGILTMVSRNMVMKWFEQNRGFVTGLMGVFTSFGFAAAPGLFNNMIGSYGWEHTYLILAVAESVLFAAVVLVLFRDNPQQHGLKPDGEFVINVGKKKPVMKPVTDFSLAEAKATYSFWVFALVFGMFALWGTALTFLIEPIFAHAGYGNGEGFKIFLPTAFISMGIPFLVGWLSDFVRLKYMLIVLSGSLLISMVSLAVLGHFQFAFYTLIIGNGLSNGLFGILSSVTWPRFFGTKHLGAISGMGMAFMVGGSAIGPFMLSISFDVLGEYYYAALLCGGITLALFVMSFFANNVNENVLQGRA